MSVNPDQMHAETVDDSNPLAVADAVARKRALLLEGKGPALLDVECYRRTGHSTTDASVYRSREDLKASESFDLITQFARAAIDNALMTEDEVTKMREAVAHTIEHATRAAVDPAIAPIVDVPADPTPCHRLINAQPDACCGEFDEGQKVGVEFLISGCDGPVMLEFREEPLDPDAAAVSVAVQRRRAVRRGIGRMTALAPTSASRSRRRLLSLAASASRV